MARDCVRFAAEFEPLGKGGRAAVDRPAGGDPQDLALGTLRRRAARGQIRKLPRNQPAFGPSGRCKRPASQCALEVQKAQSPSKMSHGTSRTPISTPSTYLRTAAVSRAFVPKPTCT
jgi:hypothetical protein